MMNGDLAALYSKGEQVGGVVNWNINASVVVKQPVWEMRGESYYWISPTPPDEVRLFLGNHYWRGVVDNVEAGSNSLGVLHHDVIEIRGTGELIPCTLR